MLFRKLTVLLFLVAPVIAAWAEEQGDAPRTGYFHTKTTTLELLGPAGAESLAGVFEADEELKWALYVPTTYSPSKPVGVMVFVSPSNRWGGSQKLYNTLLDDRNLIWAGIIGAGDQRPVNMRAMRAILTPTFLARDYVLDPARIYIGGFSGGAHVANILATGKPALFKGGMFVGGAVAWKDEEPEGIDLVRQNRYVFIAGSNDVSLRTVRQTAATYRDAGIEQTELFVMPNERQEMPGPMYLEKAIDYLDGRTASDTNE